MHQTVQTYGETERQLTRVCPSHAELTYGYNGLNKTSDQTRAFGEAGTPRAILQARGKSQLHFNAGFLLTHTLRGGSDGSGSGVPTTTREAWITFRAPASAWSSPSGAGSWRVMVSFFLF